MSLRISSVEQLRNDYLDGMEVKEYFAEWEAVFAWCRNSFKRLHISGLTNPYSYCPDISHFLKMTSKFCQCLKELTLKNGCGENGETVHTINASTQAVLIVKKMCVIVRQ